MTHSLFSFFIQPRLFLVANDETMATALAPFLLNPQVSEQIFLQANKTRHTVAITIIVIVALLVLTIVGVVLYFVIKKKRSIKKEIDEKIKDGNNYKCKLKIYKIENRKKRWYPTAEIYMSWGSPNATEVSCKLLDQVPSGDDMPLKQ